MSDDNNKPEVEDLLYIEKLLDITGRDIYKAVQCLQALYENRQVLLTVPSFGKISKPTPKCTSPAAIVEAYKRLMGSLLAFDAYQASMFVGLIQFSMIKQALLKAKDKKDVMAYLEAFNRLKEYRLSGAFDHFCQHLSHIKKQQEKYFELIVQSKLYISEHYSQSLNKHKSSKNKFELAKKNRAIQHKIDSKISRYRTPIQALKLKLLSLSNENDFNVFNLESARLFSCQTTEVFSFDVLNTVVLARYHQDDVLQQAKSNAWAMSDGLFDKMIVFNGENSDRVKSQQQMIFLYLLTKVYQEYYNKSIKKHREMKDIFRFYRESLRVPLKKLWHKLIDFKILVSACYSEILSYHADFKFQYDKLVGNYFNHEEIGYMVFVNKAKSLKKDFSFLKDKSHRLYEKTHQWEGSIYGAWNLLMGFYEKLNKLDLSRFIDTVVIDISKFRLIETQFQQGWLKNDPVADHRYQVEYNARLEEYCQQARLKLLNLYFLIRLCNEYLTSQNFKAIVFFRDHLIDMVKKFNGLIAHENGSELAFLDLKKAFSLPNSPEESYIKSYSDRGDPNSCAAQPLRQWQKALVHNKDLTRWIIKNHKCIDVDATVGDYQRLNQSLLVPRSKQYFKRMLSKVICQNISRDSSLDHIYYLSKQAYYHDLLDNSVLRGFIKHTMLKSNSCVLLRFLFRGRYGTESKIHKINQTLYQVLTTQASYRKLLAGIGIVLSNEQHELVWHHHEKLLDARQELIKQKVAIQRQTVAAQQALPCRSESSFLSGLGQWFKSLFCCTEGVASHYQPLLSSA